MKVRQLDYLDGSNENLLRLRDKYTLKDEQINYYEEVDGKLVWYTTAFIRMKDLSDFFNKLPLSTKFDCKLVINVNTGYCSFNRQ